MGIGQSLASTYGPLAGPVGGAVASAAGALLDYAIGQVMADMGRKTRPEPFVRQQAVADYIYRMQTGMPMRPGSPLEKTTLQEVRWIVESERAWGDAYGFERELPCLSSTEATSVQVSNTADSAGGFPGAAPGSVGMFQAGPSMNTIDTGTGLAQVSVAYKSEELWPVKGIPADDYTPRSGEPAPDFRLRVRAIQQAKESANKRIRVRNASRMVGLQNLPRFGPPAAAWVQADILDAAAAGRIAAGPYVGVFPALAPVASRGLVRMESAERARVIAALAADGIEYRFPGATVSDRLRAGESLVTARGPDGQPIQKGGGWPAPYTDQAAAMLRAEPWKSQFPAPDGMARYADWWNSLP